MNKRRLDDGNYESSGDDQDTVFRSHSNTNIRIASSQTAHREREAYGPVMSNIEHKLTALSMPKYTNMKLSPSGISSASIGNLMHNFGQHAPALYQLIRLTKWELFISNILSNYEKIQLAISTMLKSCFHLEI